MSDTSDSAASRRDSATEEGLREPVREHKQARTRTTRFGPKE